jgi:hypothetical protein
MVHYDECCRGGLRTDLSLRGSRWDVAEIGRFTWLMRPRLSFKS